jgi:PAS domain S-box-containing protein
MHPVVVFDFVSFLASLTGLFFLVKGWKRVLPRDAKLLLTGLLVFITFYSLCLVLEWSGITKALDTTEDLIGALMPMWWAFVFYAFLQGIASSDLRSSENRYRRLVGQSKDATFQVGLDGKITFASPACQAILGYGPEAFVSDPDLLPRIVHPDYRQRFDTFWEEYHTRGIFPEHLLEWGWIHKDGHTIYTENVFTNLLDARGNLIGFQTIARDITDRKRAEDTIVQAKEDWENTFDAITDMVMLLDNEHHIIRVNKAAAEALNTTKDSLANKKCYEAIHGRNQPISGCPLLLTKKTLEPHTVEITEPNLGGTFICSTSPILNRARKLTGYTHSLKDITESKRLQVQLQHALRMEAIGTLAGGIAHDFNNLLMGVQGYVSLMLMDRDDTDPDYKWLRNIEKQIQSGVRLTSHLLGYARKGKYEVKPVDLNQLARETCETFGRTRKDITIHKEFADDLRAAEADPSQIEQVLLNLCVNAADAMPRGGNLIVKTMNTTHDAMRDKLYSSKPGNYVQLTVTDTGIGMDKNTIERIFEPFFTTKEMGHGTGLGLASAYGVIKAHGGYIDAESMLGEGTTFTIHLPASEKEAHRAVTLDDKAVKGSETVLLTDDERTVRRVGREMLEALGYNVMVAKDGKEAIELYSEHWDHIDIILLDLVMPTMGGSEAYDALKQINPDVKVLLLSGYSIDGQATEILRRGCNGFIQKPFNLKELSGEIRQVLAKK